MLKNKNHNSILAQKNQLEDKQVDSCDSIFYRDSKKGMRLIVKARQAMFKLFLDQVKPTKNSKILETE